MKDSNSIIFVDCVAVRFQGMEDLMPGDWLFQPEIQHYQCWCHIWATWWHHQGHWCGESYKILGYLWWHHSIPFCQVRSGLNQVITHKVDWQYWRIEPHTLGSSTRYQPIKLRTCQYMFLNYIILNKLDKSRLLSFNIFNKDTATLFSILVYHMHFHFHFHYNGHYSHHVWCSVQFKYTHTFPTYNTQLESSMSTTLQGNFHIIHLWITHRSLLSILMYWTSMQHHFPAIIHLHAIFIMFVILQATIYFFH